MRSIFRFLGRRRFCLTCVARLTSKRKDGSERDKTCLILCSKFGIRQKGQPAQKSPAPLGLSTGGYKAHDRCSSCRQLGWGGFDGASGRRMLPHLGAKLAQRSIQKATSSFWTSSKGENQVKLSLSPYFSSIQVQLVFRPTTSNRMSAAPTCTRVARDGSIDRVGDFNRCKHARPLNLMTVMEPP